MAGERSGTRKSKRVAAMETKKPRKSPKTISLSDLPKKPGPTKRPGKKSGSEPKHPTYFQMVVEAIVMLKERAGSSRQAIVKFIGERYRKDLPENFKLLLNNQLRSLTAKGKIIQVRRGSFKLPEEVKNSKEVKELKKSTAGHMTAAKVEKKEKMKVEGAKAKRAKPAAKKTPVKKKSTPQKKVSVKTEILSSRKMKPEVAGSNPSTATRKSGRVSKPVVVVAAGSTTPAKRRGRK